ncbi:gluconate 2-dehydrogenase subunit 3 family protein [Fodinicurvata sp. EGI_FJ10296]|uniref:gluconate 2-dehydrogenase subunit 3 family protein n=1 Tax=Fodinicurvata sp. EGI_FJ10296 TaxID=3231908 RepID=UPI003452E6F0
MRMRRRSFMTLMASSSIVAFCPSLATGQRMTEGGGRYFFLSDAEARFLTAACDRLIPEDEFPSASQAGVVDYIDLQMATGFGRGERFYMRGPHPEGTAMQGYQLPHPPAEVFRMAIAGLDEAIGEGGFAGLQPGDMDLVLTELEEGVRAAGEIPGGAFFDLLAAATIEGYFSDPVYNGNRDHAGWRMVGFPGAHAYYLDEVDRYDLAYHRPPSGIAWQPGLGIPPRISPGGMAPAGAASAATGEAG